MAARKTLETHASFPPIIGVDQLSVLIDKSPATIFADRSRAPHKIPPAYLPPGCKSPRWLLVEVIEWLKQHPEPPAVPRAADAPKRGPGRPGKAERIAAAAAGLSVGDYRKQQGGAA